MCWHHRLWMFVWIVFVGLLAGCGSSGQKPILVVYCAAGLRPPIEQIAREYEKVAQVTVRLQFAGSHDLLHQAELSGEGDLYIPAEDDYLRLAQDRQLIAESLPLASQHPILAMRAEGGPPVSSFAELLESKLELGLADPDRAAVGRLLREALKATGQWEAFEKRAKAVKPTVIDVANDVKLGAVDAGVVWDATIARMPSLKGIDLPLGKGKKLSDLSATVSVAVLRSTTNPSAALRFARFLAASDQGGAVFADQGYTAARGDPWDPSPRLTLFCGSMFRPALEPILEAFEAREGVTIKPVYAGCGILCTEMASGETPDAYFACDTCYTKAPRVAPEIADRFEPSPALMRNPLVLVTEKDNPKKIRTLADLAGEGIEVGLCDPDKSALGELTRRMLTRVGQAGIYDKVKDLGATGDLLVNKLRTGAVHVVIAYTSNTAGCRDQVEVIPIDDPGAVAEQPFLIARTSAHRQLASRLRDAIRKPESLARFEALGFKLP